MAASDKGMMKSTALTVALCSLGLHDWEYFAMAPEFQVAFPDHGHVGRLCRCCRELQYQSDDKRGWNRGAYSVTITLGQRRSNE